MQSEILSKLLKTWFLEFLQNFPLACAFLYGYAQTSAGQFGGAAAAVLGGTLAGVVLIRLTEPLISGGQPERPAETVSNFILFSASIILAIPYFHWPSSSWLTDLLLGAGIGALASAIQARAACETISPLHTAALMTAFSAALLVLRYWALSTAPLPAAIGLSGVVTTIITAIEYAR